MKITSFNVKKLHFSCQVALSLSLFFSLAPMLNAQKWSKIYAEKEMKASQPIKAKLEKMRLDNKSKNLSINIGYTSVTDKSLTSLTGLKMNKTLKPQMKTYLDRQPKVSDKISVGVPINQHNTGTDVGCVRDQGTCGSCWAFGAMGAYESNYISKTGLSPCDIDVSEQHVVNCSMAGSCGGGDSWGVLDWMVNQSKSVEAEAYLSYQGADAACPTAIRSNYYYATRWGTVHPNNDWTIQPSINSIKNAIIQYGAVTSCLLATENLQNFGGDQTFYEIPTNRLAGDNVNHCITIVGWDDLRNAWRIKNSWGTAWAEGGYAWIDYNTNNIGKATAWIEAKIPQANQRYPSYAQNQVSYWLYTGDIDGNKVDDFLRLSGAELRIFKQDFEKTPILTHRFGANVKRLVVGDFVSSGREHGKKQVCAILADGSLQAFAISDDLKSLWWWFTQPNFIQDNEDFVVGDFDGDNADEILVHNPQTGRIRFYKIGTTGVFQDFNKYTLGNLEGRNLVNKKILKGEFGETNCRIDLLVVDYEARQIHLFVTALEGNGNFTFWWGFTTNSNLFTPTSKVYMANIQGSQFSDIIIRDDATGSYRLCKPEFNNGNLTDIQTVKNGQLPLQPGKAEVMIIKTTNNRDDIALFSEPQRTLIYTASAQDANISTYWWGYTSDRIFN
jgi:C1A family cysteine protease